MSHLEYDWQSPIWRHTLLELSREHTLVRFDQRSNGLSDWDVNEVSFDAFVNDLAAVVDVGVRHASYLAVPAEVLEPADIDVRLVSVRRHVDALG